MLRDVRFVMKDGVVFKRNGVMTPEKFFHSGPVNGWRLGGLTVRPGALGRLEDLTAWLSAWQGRHPPQLGREVQRPEKEMNKEMTND